jgi:hypothetical protein
VTLRGTVPFLAAALLALPAWADAPSPTRILAFASRQHLGPFIGKFDSRQGWVQPDDFYQPPDQSTPVTIYGLKGRLGEVYVADKRRAAPDGVAAGWSATVSNWPWKEQPHALAVIGREALDAASAREVPRDDPALVSLVSRALKKKGLQVPVPYLTQSFQADVTGDGQDETLAVAHSDESALRDDVEAFVYAIAIVAESGKEPVVVASQTAYKPARRSIEEHQRLNGTRDFYRFIAIVDLDGEGAREIVLYNAERDATQVEVFTLDGASLKKRLTTERVFR